MAEPVVLGIDKETGKEICLSGDARPLGSYVVGLQGMGKSNLLLQIALTDIANNEGVCVLTPHPELIQDILMRLPKKRHSDVIVFDPSDECPVGLNIFEWSGPGSDISIDKIADDVVTETFKRLWADMWGPRMEEMMATVARTILWCQALPLGLRPTLAEFAKVIGRGGRTAYREFLLSHIESQHGNEVMDDLVEYWEWFDEQSPRFREEIASSTLNKARPFRANELARYVVGQSTNKVDFRSVMNEGKILLVDLNIDNLGTGNVELLGSLVVGRLLLAALGRETVSPQRQFHIIADEFGFFATPAFAKLQDQSRKFGVDVLVAHQRRGQLDLETRDATRTARNWVVFNVNPEDARELSEGFDSTPPEPEATGEKQSLIHHGNPWDVLKSRGHQDAEVNQLVQAIDVWLYIEPSLDHKILTIRWGRMREGRGKDPKPVFGFPNSGTRDIFVKALNEFLYSMMTLLGKGLAAHMEEAGLAEITPEQIDSSSVVQKYRSLASALANQLFRFEWKPEEAFAPPMEWGVKGRWVEVDDRPLFKYEEARRQVDEALAHCGGDWNQVPFKLWSEVRRMSERLNISRRIVLLGSLLSTNPLWVQGGQPEDTFEQRRHYSDVREEWKNRFAHLSQYEVWCRVQEEREIREHHGRTVRAEDPPENGHAIAQLIREQSREAYGVCREEIEEMLVARMAFSDDVTTDEGESSISLWGR